MTDGVRPTGTNAAQIPKTNRLRQHLADHARRLDAGQPGAQAAVLVGEPLVVDPEQVHDRRLQIPDVHRVLHDVVREVVGLAVDDAALDSAAAIHRLKQRGWWSRP